MAIFVRREIPRAIDLIAKQFSREQVNNLVKRLNGNPIESVAAEWETILLSAFCQHGFIKHEESYGGKTRPDIFYQDKQNDLEFLTDIRSISDSYLHQTNPYFEFTQAISKYLQKNGYNSGGIFVDVENIEEESYPNRKVKLTLPPINEIEAFVATELHEFLLEIVKNPDESKAFRYNKNQVCFTIDFNSYEKRFNGGNHINYTLPYSRKNSLKNALQRKGEQLIKSGYLGSKGIIICDGGCDALRGKTGSNGAYSCQEIVHDYLIKHAYILWVLVIRIEANHFPLLKTTLNAKAEFFSNHCVDNGQYQKTFNALDKIIKFLPQPEATPTNAINHLNSKKGKTGRSHIGGFHMNGNSIKISARALTDLLAGHIDAENFRKIHGFVPDPRIPENHYFPFFKNQIELGNTLQNAFVEKDINKDDDWIVFEYDGPDPAISPYRTP